MNCKKRKQYTNKNNRSKKKKNSNKGKNRKKNLKRNNKFNRVELEKLKIKLRYINLKSR